jgi:hypothetical protein
MGKTLELTKAVRYKVSENEDSVKVGDGCFVVVKAMVAQHESVGVALWLRWHGLVAGKKKDVYRQFEPDGCQGTAECKQHS